MGVLSHRSKCAAPALCEQCSPTIEEMLGEDVKRCAICGAQPSAYWRDELVFAVCPTCAVDVLPKLMADAVIGPHCGHKTVIARLHEAERRAQAAFWEAAACAIAHAATPLTPRPPCPYEGTPSGHNGKAHGRN